MDHLIDPHEVKGGDDVYVILASIHNPASCDIRPAKIIQSPENPHIKTVYLQNKYCRIEENHVLFKTEQDARNYYEELFH
ncbi:transcriptional regulator of the spore photoproduct lyase operon [Thalassobacillus cyri]|uniref:Transcriptional regulator of the spore photoproduct lyase operon n=1 Tax=Thalassobacillus cyri TaxID=571932 RepID=A0A1H4CW04_9BACI|nr:transcriptional regulator SplA domain-containing protein [Thalassobacillus cyri]SEA64530.1 transcriptional regulator of the spore photoproduct lyase operon [Thalassobacillus cyri]